LYTWHPCKIWWYFIKICAESKSDWVDANLRELSNFLDVGVDRHIFKPVKHVCTRKWHHAIMWTPISRTQSENRGSLCFCCRSRLWLSRFSYNYTCRYTHNLGITKGKSHEFKCNYCTYMYIMYTVNNNDEFSPFGETTRQPHFCIFLLSGSYQMTKEVYPIHSHVFMRSGTNRNNNNI